ncbi:hypothetical protein QUF80_19815 [Desulfococcaceae bacterium HSG8]|nr:hypothetical protein [Desulfococcaceae bacterium HSG8]
MQSFIYPIRELPLCCSVRIDKSEPRGGGFVNPPRAVADILFIGKSLITHHASRFTFHISPFKRIFFATKSVFI